MCDHWARILMNEVLTGTFFLFGHPTTAADGRVIFVITNTPCDVWMMIRARPIATCRIHIRSPAQAIAFIPFLLTTPEPTTAINWREANRYGETITLPKMVWDAMVVFYFCHCNADIFVTIRQTIFVYKCMGFGVGLMMAIHENVRYFSIGECVRYWSHARSTTKLAADGPFCRPFLHTHILSGFVLERHGLFSHHQQQQPPFTICSSSCSLSLPLSCPLFLWSVFWWQSLSFVAGRPSCTATLPSSSPTSSAGRISPISPSTSRALTLIRWSPSYAGHVHKQQHVQAKCVHESIKTT